jgi:hypothetical protein
MSMCSKDATSQHKGISFVGSFCWTDPSIAILSHRWGDEEVSYSDYAKRRVTKGNGFQKIVDFCDFAKSQPEAYQ